MEIADIRRTRLRDWFKERSIPPDEKSYLSQLMTGKASFGEKAARRLEGQYGMSPGYLDAPLDGQPQQAAKSQPTDELIRADEIAELIVLFSKASASDRGMILNGLRARTKGNKSGKVIGN